MKRKGFCVLAMILLLSSSAAAAADFGWVTDFNLRAYTDPSGYRAQIAARFRVGEVQITAVLGDVSSPADAYIVFRLGEMSRRPIDDVLKQYKTSKGKGWGVVAQSLGIKPGSAEFQALKKGQDLYPNSPGKAKGQKKH